MSVCLSNISLSCFRLDLRLFRSKRNDGTSSNISSTVMMIVVLLSLSPMSSTHSLLPPSSDTLTSNDSQKSATLSETSCSNPRRATQSLLEGLSRCRLFEVVRTGRTAYLPNIRFKMPTVNSSWSRTIASTSRTNSSSRLPETRRVLYRTRLVSLS